MSTDRLNITDELQEQLGTLGQDARKAGGKIEDEIKGKRRRQENVALGAAALIQQSEDEIRDLEEERGQMDEIRDRAERLLGSAQSATPPPEQPAQTASEPTPSAPEAPTSPVQPPEPEPAPDVPEFMRQPTPEPAVTSKSEPPAPFHTRQQLDEFSLEELRRVAEAWGHMYPDEFRAVEQHVRAALTDWILVAQQRWPNEKEVKETNSGIPAPPPTPDGTIQQSVVVVEQKPEKSPYDPRNWHWMCKLFAAVGAFVGFIVGMNTHEEVSGEVNNWTWVPGVIWVIAFVGIGFYLFGLVCAIVRDWLQQRGQ